MATFRTSRWTWRRKVPPGAPCGRVRRSGRAECPRTRGEQRHGHPARRRPLASFRSRGRPCWAQAIADSIAEAIATGHLRPGERVVETAPREQVRGEPRAGPRGAEGPLHPGNPGRRRPIVATAWCRSHRRRSSRCSRFGWVSRSSCSATPSRAGVEGLAASASSTGSSRPCGRPCVPATCAGCYAPTSSSIARSVGRPRTRSRRHSGTRFARHVLIIFNLARHRDVDLEGVARAAPQAPRSHQVLVDGRTAGPWTTSGPRSKRTSSRVARPARRVRDRQRPSSARQSRNAARVSSPGG